MDAVELGNELGHLPGLAHGYFLLHIAHTATGHPDRAAFRGLALPIYEELGDLMGQAHVLNNLGIEAYYDGRWDEALDLYGRSKEARTRIGDVVNAALVANNIGEIHSDQGRLAEARALFDEAREVAGRAGGQLTVAVSTLNLGRVAAREGRFDDARGLIVEALEALQALDARNFVLEAEARLAEVTAAAGDAEEGLRLADEGLAHASDVDVPLLVGAILHRARGLALRAAGDEAEAVASFEASLEAAHSVGADYEVALALTALGRDREAAPVLARLGVDRLGPV
jgi:tetratricopeptide (TPR) repeat protein